MNFKILTFFILFSVLIQAKNNSFDYYADGVYDAYTEIQNSLRRGLKERKLKDLNEKWLIVQNISNDSTVQLIFYRTVAYKNNFLETVIAKNNQNLQNYIIYGSYTRKADAIYASKKLFENGIKAKVVYSGKNSSYVNNPIIIKKLILDMKKLLKDTPVIYVKETEILESTQSKQKCIPVIKYVEKKQKHASNEKFVKKQFYILKTRFRNRGTIMPLEKIITYKERSGFLNKYGEKDFFKGFKITNIYLNTRTHYKVVKLLGTDGKTYKLYQKESKQVHSKKDCDCDENKTKTKAKSDRKAKKTTKSVTAKKIDSQKHTASKKDGFSLLQCDFNKINTARLANGKQVDISNTHYAGKVLDVKVREKGDKMEILHHGFEKIYVKNYYKRFCKNLSQ